jgi:hypothetical protein
MQRAIEMLGIQTVLITLVPENSRQMGPSRAIHPVGFTLGDCTGGPFQKDLQRKVVLDALKRWEARLEAGVLGTSNTPNMCVTWRLRARAKLCMNEVSLPEEYVYEEGIPCSISSS